MSWDSRICPSGHLGTAKRCHCGQDTRPWYGEDVGQETELDRLAEKILRERINKPE